MPVSLEWSELTYKVPVGKGKKRSIKVILNELSGALPPGRLLAVMGEEGGPSMGTCREGVHGRALLLNSVP